MTERYIDLNADLGESPEALASGADLELMRFITSANIACGGHAGDDSTMQQTLRAARDCDVAVGAHPSYRDRANFGRIVMSISPQEIEATVREQISRLAEIAERLGMHLVHVKPHGALYHAARDRQISEAIGSAVISIDRHLVMVGQAGSPTLSHWRAIGLETAGEGFADRAYECDGTLRNRNLAGALLHTPEEAAQQALEIALHRRAITQDGYEIPVPAETLCIHSDTPNASAIAQEVRSRLNQAGLRVVRLARRKPSIQPIEGPPQPQSGRLP
jgi:5-oxoprolinase (ATP-hydrolysing) subunit A